MGQIPLRETAFRSLGRTDFNPQTLDFYIAPLPIPLVGRLPYGTFGSEAEQVGDLPA